LNFRDVIAATRYRSAIRSPFASTAPPQQALATGTGFPGPAEHAAARQADASIIAERATLERVALERVTARRSP
jgi:hypothetical protein